MSDEDKILAKSPFEPEKYFQFYRPMMYQTILEADDCTALFLLVCRNTLGYHFTDREYKLCWEWPGNKEVAKTLKIESLNPDQSISKVKSKLIKRLMLLEWKVNNDLYVGPNVAILNASTKVNAFLHAFRKEYHFMKFGKPRWWDAAEKFAEEHNLNDCLEGVKNFEQHTIYLQNIESPYDAHVDNRGKVIK
ncbi:MAG: hypothetical protein ACLQVJ_06885 [Syntrophobacteraceae bacterium]